MDLSLPENVCFQCNSTVAKLLVCDKCDCVAYCSAECRKKDFRKHKKTCFQIHKLLKKIVIESKEDIRELIFGFEHLDLSLNYGSAKQFKIWTDEVYSSSYYISMQLRQLCEKRLSRLTVEQLLYWKMKEIKHSHYDGVNDYNFYRRRSITEISFILVGMNCLTALGRYQKALDFVSHWRRKEALDSEEEVERPIQHYKNWVNGEYDKENITKKFDLFRFVTGEGSDVTELSIGYNLVIIKLYVIAVMKNHLSKRKSFLAFMQGTNPRLGEDSPVMKIACMSPAVRLIANHCGVSSNPLGVASNTISASSLAQNKLHLESLLTKLHALNPYAIFSMSGEYSLRKLDFQTEEEFMSHPSVQASWSAGTWTRVFFEKLEDSERDMFIQIARMVFKQPKSTELSDDHIACFDLRLRVPGCLY